MWHCCCLPYWLQGEASWRVRGQHNNLYLVTIASRSIYIYMALTSPWTKRHSQYIIEASTLVLLSIGASHKRANLSATISLQRLLFIIYNTSYAYIYAWYCLHVDFKTLYNYLVIYYIWNMNWILNKFIICRTAKYS
jgi:hypothetical protein